MSSSEPRELLGIDPSELRFACAFSPPACFSRFDSVFAVIFSSFYGFPDGFHSENASFLCGADFGVSLLLFFLHFEVLFTRTFWRLPNLWPYLFPLFPNFPSFCFLRSNRSCSRVKEADLVYTASNKQNRWIRRLQGNWIISITVYLFTSKSEYKFWSSLLSKTTLTVLLTKLYYSY
jgi:hypothetical protein